jgi:hypothetical protein
MDLIEVGLELEGCTIFRNGLCRLSLTAQGITAFAVGPGVRRTVPQVDYPADAPQRDQGEDRDGERQNSPPTSGLALTTGADLFPLRRGRAPPFRHRTGFIWAVGRLNERSVSLWSHPLGPVYRLRQQSRGGIVALPVGRLEGDRLVIERDLRSVGDARGAHRGLLGETASAEAVRRHRG